MKYSNGLIISTAALAILTTGCVKKPSSETVVYDNSQPVYDNSQQQPVYDNAQQQQPVYEDAAPIVYEDPINSSASGVDYGTGTTDDSTIITTDTYSQAPVITTDNIYTPQPVDNTASTDIYNQPTTTTDIYSQPATTTDIYSQPATTTTNTSTYSTNDVTYPDPYATGSSSSSSYPDPYASRPATTSSSTYTTNNSYTSSSSSSSSSVGGGIHLQIAALKDYYAAKEFKNSLSLDPKYKVYIKRGAINKVIISGISSVSEVNDLKNRRFPGAFIVKRGATSSSSSSYSYSDNSSSNSYGSSDIGVQIGAFSSRERARAAAGSASSKYTALVKKGSSNGKTIYKAILTGFSSESAARRFIANRGDGFLVHGVFN